MYDIYECEFGLLQIVEDEIGIVSISLMPKEYDKKNIKEGKFSKLAKQQLDEYFSGKRQHFDVPLHFIGTPFQQKVWNALVEIPYGETRSYEDIAKGIDCPKGCRAIGMANNKNPIVIIVPCHRVIGKNGSLVGYALGLDRKQKLLALEKGDSD